MDVHVHMSYCTPCGFRVLAENYLGIKDDHELFKEIMDSIKATPITPAEVAEQLIKNDDPDIVLKGLIQFLQVKKKEHEEADAKKRSETGGADKESQIAQKVESVTDAKVENDQKRSN